MIINRSFWPNYPIIGEALLMLSEKAANKGYSVVIGKKRSLYENAKFFQKGVFFFKGMGPKNIKPMQKLKELPDKGPKNVTNALFVGSTTELQKMLKNNK